MAIIPGSVVQWNSKVVEAFVWLLKPIAEEGKFSVTFFFIVFTPVLRLLFTCANHY